MRYFKNMRKLTLVILMFFSSSLWGGVNLKNGNFYVSYTDIVVPGGGKNLKITRTYNSKSVKHGWFGFGWGSNFETNLTVSADGSVVIREYGSGSVTRFTPKEEINVDDAVSRILKAMEKQGQSVDGSYGENLRKELTENEEKRRKFGEKYRVKVALRQGTELLSVKRGLQKIIKMKKGYVRTFTDGNKEIFDERGKLLKISQKNGYEIRFNYKNNKLSSIKDSDAKQIFFKWYGNGKVKSISSVGKKKSIYKYDKGNLIEATDIGGNTYKHKYDDKKNMLLISYSDKSTRAIEYEDTTGFVKKITGRDGSTTIYEYENNPKNKDLHYWTIVKNEKSDGVKSTNRYEYELKRRKDGSSYTYRTITSENGLKTETTYNDCCSLPLKVEKSFSFKDEVKKDITSFKYNQEGLLVEKETSDGRFVKLDYHKKFNKITKVSTNNGTTKFKYNKQGKLSQALDQKGNGVLIIYDRKGRIGKMVDFKKESKSKRSLTFKFNSIGKPVQISMSNVGKINVSYDNYGNIKRVKSSSGSQIASQITSTFQSLLGIIRPAGVTLGN
jgi:YD repeat-containing protein